MSRLIRNQKLKFLLLILLTTITSLTGVQVAAQQARKVTGTVIDAVTLEPMAGVTVSVSGTTTGTITDLDGNYTIDGANANSTLKFSFVGYVTQEIPLNGRTVVDVALEGDVTGLEEIVVLGYSTQKKVNLTGSISTIDSKQLEARAVTNMSSALSGISTGVTIRQATGRPGADDAEIRIRGIGTLNDANPLIIIDGIEAPFNNISPNDIESMTVLKDAASSAIYGSRAANGVILITTKKGKKGKLQVSYNGYTGVQQATRLDDFVYDSPTYMKLANKMWTNAGYGLMFEESTIQEWEQNNDPLLYPNTDWINWAYGRNAKITSHYLNFTGGSDQSIYSLSLGYLDQQSLIPNGGSKRYNFRLNWEGNISAKAKVGANLSGNWSDTDNTTLGFFDLLTPMVPAVRSEDGRYGYAQVTDRIGQQDNAVASSDNVINKANNNQFLGKTYLDWEIIPGLKFSGNVAIQMNQNYNKVFNGYYELWDFHTDNVVFTKNQIRTATNSFSRNYQITNFNTLNYTKSISNTHNFDVLIGNSIETYRTDDFSSGKQIFYNNELTVLDAGLEPLDAAINGSAAKWSMVSFFGRVAYNYNQKYLFESNLRYDGSSRFAEGNRWGLFPSFSFGWRANEEDFLKDVKWLDNLKLRASWGKLGNQNIGYYPYQQIYSLGIDYLFGANKAQGLASTREVNSDIKWETTTTVDVGLDLTIIKKLNFTADYFNRLTDGILVPMDIPATLGGKRSPVVNLAEIRNKGWELAASYQDFFGDFSWNAGFNVTLVDNKVTKYLGEVRSGGDYIVAEGYAYKSMYGYVANDLIRSQEQLDQLNAQARELSGNPNAWYINNATAPGDILYEDLDGNGIIDSNDRQIIGNTIPRFTYGFNLGAAYKGFDFSALFQGLGNYDGYISGRFVYPMAVNLDRGYITQDVADNHWSAENPDKSTLPRLIAIDAYRVNYSLFSSFWRRDLSFTRLKSLQFGYSLPESVLNKVSLTKARIYFNGENLFTFSKYKAWDPERSQDETGVGYPNIKTMSFGIQLSF